MKKQNDSWERYALDVMEGKLRGFRYTLFRLLLLFLSKIYAGIVAFRHLLFRQHYIKEGNLGCLVISIGNLTVGGTGKTPVVEKLARELSEKGRSVAILSRGYKREKAPLKDRRKAKTSGEPLLDPVMVVSSQEEVLLDSRTAGDEPFMLANNLPGVPVVVHKDRYIGGKYAINNFGTDTLLLDDGLQYLRLRHSIDIILVDSTKPFGTGQLLPRGTLREAPKNLKKASYILLTKCEKPPSSELLKELRKHNPVAEIICCRHAPLYLENFVTGEREHLNKLSDSYVATLSGIATPESFEKSVKKLGSNIVLTRRFSDHHRFDEDEISTILERCVRRDIEFIVTTEKDAVRLPKDFKYEIPVYFLRVEIEITNGIDAWDMLISRICDLRKQTPLEPIEIENELTDLVQT